MTQNEKIENKNKTIRWWIPSTWIPTLEIEIGKWKKVDGVWYTNKQEMIIKVMRKENGKWKTTNHKFTQERAEYLARSMEELTGKKYEVVDCEFKN
jgi:hypothetical protein